MMQNFNRRLIPFLLVFSLNQHIHQHINAQINTTLIDSVDRKLGKDTVHEILSYYLLPDQLTSLSQHGCWCAKILNLPLLNHLRGGANSVDDLDHICKQWSIATKCIHSLGQNCYSYDQSRQLGYLSVTIESLFEISPTKSQKNCKVNPGTFHFLTKNSRSIFSFSKTCCFQNHGNAQN